jgi:lipid II isoglutaminyl synthase (glutamine-hydrolysing)
VGSGRPASQSRSEGVGLSPLRRSAALLAGRAAGFASRALRRGGGTALPGLIAEALAPGLASELASQLGSGSLIVTGTNGKTTTARMIAGIASTAGLQPLPNRSGSNLMRGIATALMDEADIRGRLQDGFRRLGVFEVDEATLPQAVEALRPRVLLFTNLFRDQLDRYGEVDSVAARWRRTLESADPSTAVILNADDPSVAALADVAPGKVICYGLDDPSVGLSCAEHTADARWCPSCGSDYRYSVLFYGHVGHWLCPGCGRSRPAPQVKATAVTVEDGRTLIGIETPEGQLSLSLAFSGLYNAYNALAAAAAGLALGVSLEMIGKGVSSATAAFGRQESFEVDGRRVLVLLGKNPTGLNQVLRTIATADTEKHLLFFLNDDIADGRDVSWIWDADFELLAGQPGTWVLSGTRAEDLALRLKYAGLAKPAAVEPDVAAALARALRETPAGGLLYVVPTYTAMLRVRELLARRGQRAHYWEEP